MVLVDPRSLQATPSQIDDVLPDTVRRLDREIGQILESPVGNVRDKVHKYNQVLERYLTVHEDYKRTKNPTYPLQNPVTIPPPPGQQPVSPSSPATGVLGDLKDEVLASLPQSLRSKGQLMLNYVQKAPGVTFSENGEMVVRGKTVPRSHLVDLVNEAVRPSRGTSRKPRPEGIEEFYKALSRANAPSRVYGKTVLVSDPVSPSSSPFSTIPRGRSSRRSPSSSRRRRKKEFGIVKSPRSLSWTSI